MGLPFWRVVVLKSVGEVKRARLNLAQNFVTRDWALIGIGPSHSCKYLKSFVGHCPINSYSTQISS